MGELQVTGSYISLVLVGRKWSGRRNSSGRGTQSERGWACIPHSTSWAENTITTECTQESGHLQSIVLTAFGTLINLSLMHFLTVSPKKAAIPKKQALQIS
jgi:hypothetical protein